MTTKPCHRQAVRNNLQQHALAVAIGLWSTFSSIFIIVAPTTFFAHSTLGMYLPTPIWYYGWPVLHLIGGLAVIAGVARLTPSVEAFGCVFLTATFGVNVAAILTVRGLDSGFVPALLMWSIAAGFAVRAIVIITTRDQV